MRLAGSPPSLLAKLIVTGDSRVDALRKARRALHEFEVAGVATSLPFYRWLVAREAFAPPPASASLCTPAGSTRNILTASLRQASHDGPGWLSPRIKVTVYQPRPAPLNGDGRGWDK